MRQALNHSYRFPQRAESVRTLCIRLPKVVLFLFLLLGAGSLAAQNTDQQIAAQKRLIADLEKQIAREEQEISKLKKGRARPRRRCAVWPVRSIRATSCST